MAPPPPPYFYRVQHHTSYTYYNPQKGFEANAHYHMDHSHYINGLKVRAHLNWADRSIQPTPFISIFDNYDDANQRKKFHIKRRDHGIFIAAINAKNLQPNILKLNTVDGDPVDLEIWQTPDREHTFISILALRSALRLEAGICQASEWLAIDGISNELITLL
ncbi:MAG: hypothetical protein Q9172_002508 [Xanthocarpia lactea]